jgi:hypothetical protein
VIDVTFVSGVPPNLKTLTARKKKKHLEDPIQRRNFELKFKIGYAIYPWSHS